jgi:hypothetical protein
LVEVAAEGQEREKTKGQHLQEFGKIRIRQEIFKQRFGVMETE